MNKTKYIDKVTEYDENKIKGFLEKFKNELIRNKEFLEKANSIDIEVTKKRIKLETLLEIVDTYKDIEFENINKKYIVYYKGDPFITINLFLQALLTRCKLVLVQDEFMLSINEILFTIFNEILKEFKIEGLIDRCEYSKDKILEVKNQINANLIGIGDTLMYQMLDEDGKFFPYYNIIMYCDNDMLEPLKDAISIYSNENFYEIEAVYEEDVDNAIKYMNMIDTSDIVVLLSNSKTNIDKFKSKINKTLFVNENPFLKSYGKIYDYLR